MSLLEGKMVDQRLEKLANLMLTYSLQIKKGDAFAISADTSSLPLVKAVLRQARQLGAFAATRLTDQEISRLQLELYDPEDDGMSEAFLKSRADLGIKEFENLIGEIIIRAYPNDQELAGIPPATLQLQSRMSRPFRDLVVNHRRWVLFEYPTPAQAQRSGLPYEAYFDFVLNAANFDYAEMAKRIVPLRDLMQSTQKVRLTAPGTDLSFRISNMPAIPCCGESNLPDGECFTAPVKESVNGEITFNTPSTFWGTRFENIRFVFKNGKIVEASASNDSAKLNQILDTDEGARYIGEFSIGFNPLINNPFGNTLFDEKIRGSIHLTPGACYDEAPNGNDSAIHWDLILIQRPEYGGGEIYFDDVLIRKDGLFVPASLQPLNYSDLDGGNK
jgi:aminopeptidase